jgi:serine/threonine protein phosphatase 1
MNDPDSPSVRDTAAASRSPLAWIRALFGRPSQHPPSTAPAVPDGLCVYAIGDIHGELETLNRLLEMIDQDRLRRSHLRPLLVFLGDYVDRGPNSRGVIERLSSGPLPGVECRFLLGNHEEAMLAFLEDPTGNAEWLRFGGAETLASYGVPPSVGVTGRARCEALRDALAAGLPEPHLAFLRGLEKIIAIGDYAFVHAGIAPGRRLARQRPEDLLWIRAPFLSSNLRHERVIVHGHTVVDAPEILFNRIGIDTGAYATGVLTGLALSDTRQDIIQSAPKPVSRGSPTGAEYRDDTDDR